MEQRRLGSSGLEVSSLGLGTMRWGRDSDADDASAQLAAFLDAGGTLVDTADIYSRGEAERILGKLIGRGGLVPRDQILLVTKAALNTDRPRDASRRHLLDSLDASLSRLGTDHVDLWLLHAWDATTPLEESLSALDAAVASGRVRYVGVSNYSGWQTAKAATWQRAWPGRAPIVATQMEYSLLERGIEREVLPAARDLGVGVLAWSPLGRGVLTGKYRTGIPADSRAAATADPQQFVAAHVDDRATGIVGAVIRAADGLGVAPLTVALAWLRSRAGVSASIVGARTAAQLKGSLDGLDFEVPDKILAALDEVSAPSAGYPETGPRR